MEWELDSSQSRPGSCPSGVSCCTRLLLQRASFDFSWRGLQAPYHLSHANTTKLPSSPDPLAISLSIKANFCDNINFTVQPINSNPMEPDVARKENDKLAIHQGLK